MKRSLVLIGVLLASVAGQVGVGRAAAGDPGAEGWAHSSDGSA
jgi:hypothetical protein